jgi:hypothetical protein
LVGAFTVPKPAFIVFGNRSTSAPSFGIIVPESGQLPEIGQSGVSCHGSDLPEIALDGGVQLWQATCTVQQGTKPKSEVRPRKSKDF